MFASKVGTFQVLLSSVSYWPYLQTLDLAGKAFQEQTHYLIGPFISYEENKVL
jgi:hypothetical protein